MLRLQDECVKLHEDRNELVEKLTNIQNAQQVSNAILTVFLAVLSPYIIYS